MKNRVIQHPVMPKSADQGRRIVEVNLEHAIKSNNFTSDTGASQSRNHDEDECGLRTK